VASYGLPNSRYDAEELFECRQKRLSRSSFKLSSSVCVSFTTSAMVQQQKINFCSVLVVNFPISVSFCFYGLFPLSLSLTELNYHC